MSVLLGSSGASVILGSSGGGVVLAPGSTKTVLNSGDFTYLGAFKLAGDQQYNSGLAHRYVGAELRFFFGSFAVKEFIYNGYHATEASYPTASLNATWDETTMYGTKRVMDSTAGLGDGYGLYWDETDQRLYWTYGNGYNATTAYESSFGASSWNGSTFTPVGAWGFADRSVKMAMGGILPIPSDWATAHTSGKRLGVGFGGYYSIVQTGPCSMGPALCAVDAAALTGAAHNTAVGYTELLGYPYHSDAYGAPTRCNRDNNVVNEYDSWAPQGATGYWTWNDMLWQAGTWIDIAGKHGVLFGVRLGTGRAFYYNSTLNSEGGSTYWFVYDPDDLAAVAAGTLAQHEIQPTYTWKITYPHYGSADIEASGWAGFDSKSIVRGMTFDTTTNRLYVLIQEAVGTIPYRQPLVYVYQVA